MRSRAAISSAVAVLAAAAAAAPAQACTEVWQTCVVLSSGETFMFERTWSLGELYIFLALLIIAVILMLRWFADLRRGVL